MHPITVIIPCYNEATIIQRTLKNTLDTCTLDEPPRIIVVDAGSEEETKETAAIITLFNRSLPKTTISYTRLDRPSRGKQLIGGAKMATTPFSLFLHADTMLPSAWDEAIVTTFECKENIRPLLGCFELSLSPPITFSLAVMLCVANMRARIGHLPYGDQAYFVRREEYESVGGFANVPLMEDVELLQRYKVFASRREAAAVTIDSSSGQRQYLSSLYQRYCRPSCIIVLPLAVKTSSRRWKRKGVWWNTACNQFYMLAWMAGVSPRTIYKWYYGKDIKVE